MTERKSLQELTIKDNFMFGAVMLEEDICREALERILGIPIERVEVDREKSIVYHPKYKGVRLDAYAKDANHTCYNVEIQVKTQSSLKERARYYHSQLDMDLLLTGIDYENLPNSYVIFICDFDPFEKGLYRYTVDKRCKELPEISLNDGSHTIFLSTKGTNKNDVTPELVQFLEYIRKPTEDNCPSDDSFIQKLKERIKKIKANREMGASYMTLEDLIKEERKEAKAEGHAEGHAAGRTEILLEQISKKLTKGQSIDQIADSLEMSSDKVQQLIDDNL